LWHLLDCVLFALPAPGAQPIASAQLDGPTIFLKQPGQLYNKPHPPVRTYFQQANSPQDVNMSNSAPVQASRPLELASKPDFAQAMQRIDAWFAQEVIDRPPVRFSRHNAEYELLDEMGAWPSQQARWYDAEHQIARFLRQIEGKTFHGETFPVFWPNLGPNFFAGLFGCRLEFSDVTSWAEPILHDYDQPVALDWQSEYLRARAWRATWTPFWIRSIRFLIRCQHPFNPFSNPLSASVSSAF
jgi:hypothetical protein